jgi:predicted phosphodiesterase
MSGGTSTVLLSDVHFNLSPKPQLEQSVLTLLARYPASRIVFVGDLFEFSAVDTEDPRFALRRLAAGVPSLMDALSKHIAIGGSVDWLAGNHDAPVSMLRAEVQALTGVAFRVLPWFARYAGVHVEHGHLYDRDNAPMLPLGAWSAREEPVGIALMRRFVTRYQVPDFAHAHQTTPLQGVRRALSLFGPRVPGLFTAFLRTAGGMCAEAWGRAPMSRSVADCDMNLLLSCGVPEHELADYVGVLLDERATPTHAAFSSTFMRLYLDQIAGLTAAGLGLVGLATGGGPAAWAGMGLGTGYLVASRTTGKACRYPGPEFALAQAARNLAPRLGVKQVVFGHSHVPEHTGCYLNLGSFGYSQAAQGRSYATLSSDGTLALAFLDA